jgi:hypothetical protein
MNEELIANFLSMAYPYLVILFWALVVVAIIWGVVRLIKKSQPRTKN